ncbi:adenylyltransferase/cytidyltransferase family protein [Nitratireductor aquimarinus]|uniref:adenylyltransferase/cytidyltransferase family protein n=1 Tax=Nitratireductor aquimarinus TaxID=889300 RepID=UPI002936814C|nr:adenylyltransferase/cytidyltransferase family protein [Nitratireductor aquimarinus]MDV2968897.1 adenylyltransferase/cytidyltransferase family protein [Nitratireductor aquimarinus]
MRTVLTYGTFDLLHVGHVRLLHRAADLGDRLIVGVSTDQFNQKKGKTCVMPFEDRCELVAACRVVDQVFAENDWSQKETDAVRLQADVFVMGDDWIGHFDFMKKYCEVVYLPRTPGISTTEIKSYIGERSLDLSIAR